jgi:putative ATPase
MPIRAASRWRWRPGRPTSASAVRRESWRSPRLWCSSPCAAKSNALYTAWQAARADVRTHGSLEVPLPLRNAPTALMRELGHGKGYRYAHDEPDGFAAGASYFPESLGQRSYYQPVDRGLEIRIAEKLADFRARNLAAGKSAARSPAKS